MNKIFRSGVLFFVTMMIYINCGDDFLNKIDRTSINSGSFYQSEDDAIASVNAVYTVLQNANLWARRFHFMLDFSADEVDRTDNTQGAPFELIQHTFGPGGNEHIDRPWESFYRLIAKANITIGEVGAMDGSLINDGARARVVGEAKFLRALAYFYINAVWNGGPLRTEENDTEISVPRSPASDIWALIEQDLAAAKSSLPPVWDDENAGRATSGAAQALLGKALLFQGKYAQAETELMAVINSGNYYLLGAAGDPQGVATTVEEAIAAMRRNHDFGVKNPGESIFEVQFSNLYGGFSWSGTEQGLQEGTIRPHEYGVKGKSFYNCKPSASLIAEYEGNGGTAIGDRDPRFEAFFFTENDVLGDGTPFVDIMNGPDGGYMWKKYEDSDFVSISGANDCNHDVMRFAEVYLLAAEARIQQNKVAEGVALINVIRRRADPTGSILPDVSDALSQPQALDALIHEKRVELCAEQTRRIDLVRWGIAKDHIANFPVGKHEYLPIPQGEINANEAMTEDDQNPGYN